MLEKQTFGLKVQGFPLCVPEENAKGFLAWMLEDELKGLLQTLSLLELPVSTQRQKSRRGKQEFCSASCSPRLFFVFVCLDCTLWEGQRP